MIIFILVFNILSNAQVPQSSTPAFEVKSRHSSGQEELKDFKKAATEIIPPKRKPAHTMNSVEPSLSDDNRLVMQTTKSNANHSSTPFIEIKPAKEKFKGLQRSMIIKARINDSITAYDGSKDPVKAIVTEGEYRGSVLFGHATMDRVTKNVIVAFDTFIPQGSSETYSFLATIKDQEGNSGLVGVLESRYWETFFLQFALHSASSAANATTQYSQSAFGNYNVVPGSDSAIKQGLAGGFNKMADKVERDFNSKPDYTNVRGPVYVRVYILEQPQKN